ncbi:MAG: glucose-1-phosphate adenylyltransferase subunit GlgD [Oscillospiraceae bacterium]|jgi:glucose-1-phosphate adenylyltransferase|nr:glucose-1-phosphate adenylyltransferase subunit GlgD [Oscillospiraceae bacterium]MCI1990077.1 glucose-1-phosphate adenylyltransferase subunit GlgD [Oscillospiraceae bacterium]MCI2034739.1 glucose-1-phosphate adenylyltransferase subunit GlgD [Oscillospiraceae bacterium]
MRGNNVLGLIFSNVHEEKVRELTENRTMGSVPFGGRYCLIDFPLSNMVNSGINKVGVVTKGNYQSLMDHLGSGKAWDLSRKREGLFLLPPFEGESVNGNSRVESLSCAQAFLQNSKEEYVLLTDSDTVCNIDYGDVLAQHVKTRADITVICRCGRLPDKICGPTVYTVGPDGRVRDLLVNPRTEGECCYGMGMMLIRRELLIRLVDDCVSRNLYNFERDLLQRNIPNYRVFSYEFKGFAKIICSGVAYFEANMALMLPDVRAQLFDPSRPIYTRVRDDMPARYGLGASVSNSLIADGCVIDGEVRNSVLSRGVRVGKGTVVENCVILQDSVVRPDSRLNYVIADKDVLIKNGRSLLGFESYPVYIAKGSVV